MGGVVKHCRAVFFFLVLMLLAAPYLYAEVSLAKVFSDHMVLQRDQPIHIWGWAKPGEKIEASFDSESTSTIAADNGVWEIFFQPRRAGGPFALSVRSSNAVTIKDVLVGDVWIASGQSNMEMPMKGFNRSPIKNGAEEIARADHPRVRLFRVRRTTSLYPLDEIESKDGWQICSPAAVPEFSAVGYFFAREIEQVEKVPIGVIESAWGGTPAESWMSLPGLFAGQLPPSTLAGFSSSALRHRDNLRRWKVEQDAEAASGKAVMAHSPARGTDFPAVVPSSLFNGMIAPLTSMRIRGVIWYQGEANADEERMAVYSEVFPALIQDWRKQWRQGSFPFLFVQLANWNYGSGGTWPTVREAQRRALALADTAMASAIDVGDSNNIHPGDKASVGHRLALAARAVAYHEEIEWSGPMVAQVTRAPGNIKVWFTHAHGMMVKGTELQGFEVAGPDRVFCPATATLTNETVVLSNAKVPTPAYVRYAWANDPKVNLYNDNGLPAVPFFWKIE